MDGLDTLPPAPLAPLYPHTSTAFLLTETAAAAQHHFNVLSFDLIRHQDPDPGSSPVPGPIRGSLVPDAFEAAAPQPGDLNTPVTTSGDIPSFFPNTVVEPPPISGE